METEPIHPDHYKELKSLILNLEQSPVFGGNKVTVYPGGKSKFYSLFEDIDCAESHIHIFYYAIGDDHIGNELKEKIINKVKQGIKVRLLYDGLGCNKTNRKYFKQMIEAGVEVKTFLPLSFPRFLRSVNYRNHKKIVIIDGRIAYTGGINVKDVYIDGLPWGKWNDIHFKVEGSGASGLQSVFLADWYYASGQYLSSPVGNAFQCNGSHVYSYNAGEKECIYRDSLLHTDGMSASGNTDRINERNRRSPCHA